jgi:hypothetical protein
MIDATKIAAPGRINCPVCHSKLMLVQQQPESMFCACCGVSVIVPQYSWKKYGQRQSLKQNWSRQSDVNR